MTGEACKSCSHPLVAHTDRAVYPPCEGEWWPQRPRIPGAPPGPEEVPWNVRPQWIRDAACFCKGFHSE